MNDEQNAAVAHLLAEAEENIHESIEGLSKLDDGEKQMLHDWAREGKMEKVEAYVELAYLNRSKSLGEMIAEAIPFVGSDSSD